MARDAQLAQGAPVCPRDVARRARQEVGAALERRKGVQVHEGGLRYVVVIVMEK
jgi:hypothetical protein